MDGYKENEKYKKLQGVIAASAFLMLLWSFFFYFGVYAETWLEQAILYLLGEESSIAASLCDVVRMFLYAAEYFLPLGLLLFFLHGEQFRPDIPFTPTVPAHGMLALFATLAVLTAANDAVGFLASGAVSAGIPLTAAKEALPTGTLRLFLAFVRLVILPALTEELFFRGYLLHILLPYGRTFAILVSAVLFAYAHRNILSVPVALIAGILFAYFVVRSGSLWIGIFMHLCYNLTAFLNQWAGEALSENGYRIVSVSGRGVIYLLGVIAMFVLASYYSGEKKEQPLESGAQYTEVLSLSESLRSLNQLPVWLLLCSFLYELVTNSFTL